MLRLQALLQQQGDAVAKAKRKTFGPAIDALIESGLPEVQTVLERWQAKEMWYNKQSGLYVWAEEIDRDTIRIFDFAGGAEIGAVPDKEWKQLKPNSGVRGVIAAALVQFQLAAPEGATRSAALDAIERDAEPSHLTALRAALEDDDASLADRKARLERLLTIRFGETPAEQIEAIQSFSGDLGGDLRATLNPLVNTRLEAATTLPEDADIAREITVGSDDLSRDAAYALLVEAGFATKRISQDDKRAALIANIDGQTIAGIQVATLNTDDARDMAYSALAESGAVEAAATEADVDAALAAHVFFARFIGASPEVAQAAQEALEAIEAPPCHQPDSGSGP